MPRSFSRDGYGPSKPQSRRRTQSSSGERTMFDDAHLLPRDELFSNIRKWQKHKDKDAQSAAIKANLRLVKSIARFFLNKGLEFDDVVGHGCLGLMRAIDGFDCDYGTEFSTYASYWIKQNIRRGIVNEGKMIRTPVHQYELAGKIWKFTKAFLASFERNPTPEEIAAGIGASSKKSVSIKKIVACINACRSARVFSGDVITDDMPAPKRSASLDAEELAFARRELSRQQALRAEYLSAIAALDIPERDREVFERYLGLSGYPTGKNLKEVGDDMGITRERVRQIVNDVARKLAVIHKPWGDYKWYLTQPALIETIESVVG